MTDSDSTTETSSPTRCPACQARLPSPTVGEGPLNFCVFCGAHLGLPTDKATTAADTATVYGVEAGESTVSFVSGHTPEETEVTHTLGPYQVLRSIGKGGMGEVFLAYDTICGRRLALKKIREDLVERHLLYQRFLKEARITSQLTHPAIIPIYSIHASEHMVYYTMPFLEGETLKQILRKTRQAEKGGKPPHQIGGSIAALVRIFMTICQAVAYAHSHGVLHRDLKPENVMIGRFGEVMILDWGLAKLLEAARDSEEANLQPVEQSGSPELTRLGKVVGTVAYMAPERALGKPATVQTEIFALGVTLYQILTLHLPFRRGTLKEFRKAMDNEELLDPAEVAPYREVPPALSQIVKRSLARDPGKRYHTVQELIHDLEIYLEGKSEWFPQAKLDVNIKEDWEFQENVLIAEHVEITRNSDLSDWFSLMISQSSFPENVRVDAKIRIGDNCSGIGVLLGIPEPPEREHLIDGYCLWLGTERFKDTKILRSNVEVLRIGDAYLRPNTLHQVRIEKADNNIHFYLDGQLQMSYISHLPAAGTHVGLLSRDHDFEIVDLSILGGSHPLTVNCLAIPDAFLAHKDYGTALNEYRRIAYSFPGRAEGREALFRAGITLIEQAKNSKSTEDASRLYEGALEEFAKLHNTPGAPMEYLGKALVYQTQQDYEEEVKCFELTLRRYPRHPLLHVIEEKIVHRMHESSRSHRKATYNFVLLVIRHLPQYAETPHAQRLFNSLKRHWEPLPFFQPCRAEAPCDTIKNRYLAISLAFWLAKPYVLMELLSELAKDPVLDSVAISDALWGIIELGSWKLASNILTEWKTSLEEVKKESLQEDWKLWNIAILSHEHSVSDAIHRFQTLDNKDLGPQEIRLVRHLLEQTLDLHCPKLARDFVLQLDEFRIAPKDRLFLQAMRIWAELMDHNLTPASFLLSQFPLALLSDERSPLYFLYGCWLHASEGPEIAEIHFSGLLDTPYPRTWALTGNYLTGKIGENQRWFDKAFLWEKRQLYRQLWLYYLCGGDTQKAEHYHKQAREGFVYVSD